MRGHVALAAGVGVGLPGAAHVLGALEHDEVREAFLLQPGGHSEPAETGPDDDDLVVAHEGTSVRADSLSARPLSAMATDFTKRGSRAGSPPATWMRLRPANKAGTQRGA